MWMTNHISKDLSVEQTVEKDKVEAAVSAFRNGEPVLVHDDEERENETDLVFPAYSVSPKDVTRMREDAGGLVCVAIPAEVAEALCLPFYDELLDHPASDDVHLAYDERSSFSVTVNHRDTFTGITDNDRALTISELARIVRIPDLEEFAANFHIPGHVHLLKAAPDLLDDRRGHTELGVALARMADVPPAVVVCEMLEGMNGEAMRKSDTIEYARSQNLVHLDAASIVRAVD
jgi:3,4-dihydroxy 2-butanone 4-phosphate synthase